MRPVLEAPEVRWTRVEPKLLVRPEQDRRARVATPTFTAAAAAEAPARERRLVARVVQAYGVAEEAAVRRRLQAGRRVHPFLEELEGLGGRQRRVARVKYLAGVAAAVVPP